MPSAFETPLQCVPQSHREVETPHVRRTLRTDVAGAHPCTRSRTERRDHLWRSQCSRGRAEMRRTAGWPAAHSADGRRTITPAGSEAWRWPCTVL